MADKKKNRLPNFSSAEESLLIRLAEQHASTLENRKTDAVSWEEKRKTWDLIDEEFEAQMAIKRGPKNLREKYENMKRKTRRNLAEERKELYRTGGGTFMRCSDSNTDRLAALMGDSGTGLSNEFDSDAITFEVNPVEEHLDESMLSCSEELVAEAAEAVEISTANNWSKWTPTLLKQKRSVQLAANGEKKGREKVDTQQFFWEEENRRAADRHQWAREKHFLEIKCAKEKHALEMKEVEMKLKLSQLQIEATKTSY